MSPWQRRVRVAVAIFGVVFAAVVYFAIGDRQAAPPGPRRARLEPEVVLESASAVLRQFREARQDYVIEARRQVTYEGGATRLEGITIEVHQRGGRDFVVSGREALVREGREELEVTGDVRLEASDGLVMTADAATFSKRDATVHVPGRVSFWTGRMNGSGVGMSYDQDNDVLTIAEQAHVEVTDEGGTTLTDFTAGSATLARSDDYLALGGRVRVQQRDQVLEADRGLARLTEHEEHITFIELRGNARVVGGAAIESMTARSIDLDYTEDGQALERVVLKGSGAIVMLGRDGASGRRFLGDALELTFAADSSLTAATGRENVRVDLPAAAGGSVRSVRARAFDAAGGTGTGLTSARFTDDVEYREEPGAGGAQRIGRSHALRVVLADDVMRAAVFTGSVHFEEAGLQAFGASADYDPARGALRLSGADGGGGSRVADEQVRVDADTINVTLGGRRISASGSVKTTLRPRAASGSKLPGLLEQDEAATVNANTLDYHGAAGKAVFTGNVTLVQGQTVVRGEVLTLDQATGDLVASGPASSTMMFDTGLSIGRATEIRYEEQARRITYTTPAPAAVSGAPALATSLSQVSGPQGDLTATRVEVVLGEESGRAERVEAYSNVTVRLDVRVATGDRLTYHADEERYVMSGVATVPVTVVEACHETTGRTVTFFKLTDRIVVDGNEEVRTQTRRDSSCLQPPAR